MFWQAIRKGKGRRVVDMPPLAFTSLFLNGVTYGLYGLGIDVFLVIAIN